jgi:peroxiredoxin
MSKASHTLQVVLASALALLTATSVTCAVVAASPKDQPKSAPGDSATKKPATAATNTSADKITASKKPADKSPPDTAATPKNAGATEETKPAEPIGVPEGVPPVLLTKQHANLCRVKVGDSLPAIELPAASGGKKTKLADLYGKAATVVVFWASDREMSHLEMADLAGDVIEPFGAKGVAVVGVAVKEKPDQVAAAIKEVGKEVPMLVDDKGSAFAQVGSRRLPRTFLLDPHGKIIWFDIEYSHATRRELQQALSATVH